MATSPTRSDSATGHIKRLDESVVNKIAAGEIIHRPSNALKELIENSLDANATQIHLVIHPTCLKFLQITDNGDGIHQQDLPLLCERFATSKIQKWEDLRSVGTFGFRGEALASVSCVARVAVVTRTEQSACAWRAHYLDGKLVPAKPGQTVDPKPCAGNKGTQITVEDLFYNVPTRRRALKNGNEEYHRILDVIQRYAIHNSGVSFTCKKQGSATADIHTPVSSTSLDTIRCIYGSTIAKELLRVEHTETRLNYSVKGYVSNANYNMKKMVFLLFINHRSVESSSLKRSVDAVYSEFLPKGTHPFVYFSLDIKPENLDVNVHPTKKEVHFLNEDQIVESVCRALRERLEGANRSRTFLTQVVRAPENQLVRTDSRARTLDAYISANQPTTHAPRKKPRIGSPTFDAYSANNVQPTSLVAGESPALLEASSSPADIMEVDQDPPSPVASAQLHKRPRINVRLTSVHELREDVLSKEYESLTELFADHIFVGLMDSRLALIQHQTKLYMIDYLRLSQTLFYQLCLRGFQNFGYLVLSQPAPIYELALSCLMREEVFESDDMMNREEVAKEITEMFVSRRQMLDEYFSVKITEEGEIIALPVVLRGWMAMLEGIGEWIVRVGTMVDWTEEKACFQSLSHELALFYSVPSPTPPNNSTEHMVEHVLFSAFKKYLVAQKGMGEDGTVIGLVSLGDLYKVFERC
ncbi:putative DNA mismatch repair protein mlh1 [Gaertneriomyces semiglobifer]|nr:putative DNA mismatch repair protein mlh1 [Gaertneriomyces semiglobifer]